MPGHHLDVDRGPDIIEPHAELVRRPVIDLPPEIGQLLEVVDTPSSCRFKDGLGWWKAYDLYTLRPGGIQHAGEEHLTPTSEVVPNRWASQEG
jgi:hypothetical protein